MPEPENNNGGGGAVVVHPGPAMRIRPDNRRVIITELIQDAATGWWNLSASFDAAGRCQEIFLSTANRVGSVLDALVHDGCIMISRDCLQRGVSARDLVRRLSDAPPSLFAKALAICAAEERRRSQELLIAPPP